MAENVSDFNLATNTPHLTLTGELWGVYFEDLAENWLHDNDIALYLFGVDWSASHHQLQWYPLSGI